jgi:hypothetical protein
MKEERYVRKVLLIYEERTTKNLSSWTNPGAAAWGLSFKIGLRNYLPHSMGKMPDE